MGFKSFEDHGLRHKVGDDGHVVTLASSLPFSVSTGALCSALCPPHRLSALELLGWVPRICHAMIRIPAKMATVCISPAICTNALFVLPDATIVLRGCSNH